MTDTTQRDLPVVPVAAEYGRAQVIAVLGKGGAGKTVLSALVARALLEGPELTEKARELCAAPAGRKTVETLRLADAFSEQARKAGAIDAASALLSAGRELLVRRPGDAEPEEALSDIIEAAKALRSNVRTELVMRCLAWKLKETMQPTAART